MGIKNSFQLKYSKSENKQSGIMGFKKEVKENPEG